MKQSERYMQRWTESEDQLLYEWHTGPTMSKKDLAKTLGRSEGAINTRLSDLIAGRTQSNYAIAKAYFGGNGSSHANGTQPVEPAPPNEPLPAPMLGYDDIVLAAWRAGYEIIIPAMGITLRKPSA